MKIQMVWGDVFRQTTQELIRVGLGNLNGSSRFIVLVLSGESTLLQLLIQNFLIGTLERLNEGGSTCCNTEQRKKAEDNNTIKRSMLFWHCICTSILP